MAAESAAADPGSKYWGKQKRRAPEPTIELGAIKISEDMPEVDMVTITYEPSIGEYNLDAPEGEQTLIVPRGAFLKACKDFLGIS